MITIIIIIWAFYGIPAEHVRHGRRSGPPRFTGGRSVSRPLEPPSGGTSNITIDYYRFMNKTCMESFRNVIGIGARAFRGYYEGGLFYQGRGKGGA